ncbi:hypothetical protein TPHA_0A04520 [Tetrapisispora phaffii CBS 4417]|uniref:ATP synthase subunit delta, mitochondrial n=1 Tax=Tetrapisispora phaffii (strain ATCC 24235 / CBS 4417 / NBRC 1672 / NRRL Y-8282 / UCD 70-5) TaxID=1071381 RepID=G8BNP7_TETPH|nr:hypothetical protein TPHA_0A04520 [Tetrapisispora phaffii CBS 4417]CCE61525.1 hypothetical protein TPHA_0A04520 [Tetrapisispora phaffii CBS 4417]
MFRLSSRTILNRGLINSAAKRCYADAATSSALNTGLKLQFALPHEILFKDVTVTQVNLPVKSGQIGVLANHVPMAEQLIPGVVEIFEEATNSTPKKFFVSGGFATVQPNSTLSITSVEAFPLESFSIENVKNLLVEANKNKTSSDEKIAAEAAIQVDVLEALEAALK